MRYLFLALFFLLPNYSHAAIALNATSTGSTSSTSLTVAQACNGTDRLLVTGVVTTPTTDIVTGVTYNGAALTRSATTDYGGVAREYLYYLINPSSGTNNIVVSISGGATLIQAHSACYTGVSQSGFPDAGPTSGKVTSTDISSTLTTVADNAVHIAYFRFDGTNATGMSVSNATYIAGTSNTTPNEGLWQSNPLLVTPPASHTMTFHVDVSQGLGQLGLSFAPAAAAVAPTFQLWFMHLLFENVALPDRRRLV